MEFGGPTDRLNRLSSQPDRSAWGRMGGVWVDLPGGDLGGLGRSACEARPIDSTGGVPRQIGSGGLGRSTCDS
eukprot:5552490-Prymnesium_polylepis.1